MICGACQAEAMQQAELRFGELLRQLRTEARLTQEELADTASLTGVAWPRG